MTADADRWFAKHRRWHDEAIALRAVLLSDDVEEAIKWGKPCYAHHGHNFMIIQPMKGFLALMFFKGVLLNDPDGILEEQGEASFSQRRLCFTSVDQVNELAKTIQRFVAEAIVVEQKGLTVEKPVLVLVEELQAKLDADPAFKRAFEGLTPGRQRAYHLFVSGAKQSSTRTARVEKHVERILAGKGLRD